MGDGFAQVRFDKKGIARLVGKLPDGSALTCALAGVKTGADGIYTLPVSLVWKGKTLSSLTGEIAVRETPIDQVSDLSGGLNWNKPADSTRNLFPGGLTCTLSTTGSIWNDPKNTTALIGASDGSPFTLVIDPDSQVLVAPIEQAGNWPATNKPVLSTPPTGLTLTISPKTGAFTGKVQLPAEGGAKPKTAIFQGLLMGTPIQEINGLLHGGGFFLGHDGSASVQVRRD